MKKQQTDMEIVCDIKNGKRVFRLAKISESKPSELEQIEKIMRKKRLNFYDARNIFWEEKNGGKPPGGFTSWGDYWKAF